MKQASKIGSKLHIENEDLEMTITIRPEGGEKFSADLQYTAKVTEQLKQHPIPSGNDGGGQDPENPEFTAGGLFGVGGATISELAAHPNCVKARMGPTPWQHKEELGPKDLARQVVEKGMSIAREQYEQEKADGIVPDGMEFDDWIKVSKPSEDSVKRLIGELE